MAPQSRKTRPQPIAVAIYHRNDNHLDTVEKFRKLCSTPRQRISLQSSGNPIIATMEIAGVVLGAFPLIFLAIDGYREGAETINRIRNHETYVDTLRRRMNRVQQEFRHNLEDLLAPLTDPEKIQMLLDNPEDADWRILEEKIRQRLSGSYETYIETIQDFRLSMKRLEKCVVDTKPDETFDLSSCKVSSVRRSYFL